MFLKAAVIGIGVYGGLFAAMYAVPQLLVRDHGWSVLSVGVWLLPGAVVGAVLSRPAGRLTAGDHGNRLLGAVSLAFAAALGGALTGSGVLLLILGASLGFSAFSVTQVFTTALMSGHIEPARRGGAMGLLNLTFFVGGGVGSACRRPGEVDVALHGARRSGALPAGRRAGRLHAGRRTP